jgi:3-phenylpropionate/trans-cinnamate dioxygenase ferredoxin reductase component
VGIEATWDRVSRPRGCFITEEMDVHWFWSDQYAANLQYAGFPTTWEQLVVRGRLDSSSYLACYVNDARIDAAVGLNRAKEVG